MRTIEGKLAKNEIGRYEIVSEGRSPYELRSGNVFEVKVSGHWVETSMEFSKGYGGYYATEFPKLRLAGLMGRVVLRW